MFLEYFNLGAAFFIIVCMVLMLGRLLGGPTLYDRLLAVNSFGTKTIIFLCIFCFIINRPDGLDIALLYALMNFIATIAVLKFFNYRCLGVPLIKEQMEVNFSRIYSDMQQVRKNVKSLNEDPNLLSRY